MRYSCRNWFNAVAIRRSVSCSQLSYISHSKSQATKGMASWSFLGPLGCLSPEPQCCVSMVSSPCGHSVPSHEEKRSSFLQENVFWSRISFKELGYKYCAAESGQPFLPLSTLWQAIRTMQWQYGITFQTTEMASLQLFVLSSRASQVSHNVHHITTQRLSEHTYVSVSESSNNSKVLMKFIV